MTKEDYNNKMEKIVSLAKRRGFIFQSSEIYGGMANAWDYGPLGVELKNNIKKLWWETFVQERDDVVGLDAAIIMNPKVWEASGHADNFNDYFIECKGCNERFRADKEPFKGHIKILDQERSFDGALNSNFKGIKCPSCSKGESGNGNIFKGVRRFNTMFKTQVGPVEDSGSIAYLRPETAQAIFTNFKNVLDTTRMKLPFGIAQIGKAFRNEITTGNFLFRTREFEQMEIEYFIKEDEWEQQFEYWLQQIKNWVNLIGLRDSNVVYKDIDKNKLAHYSKRTVDIEYKFPFGQDELYGLAYRTDYDLQQHIKHSGQNLTYCDTETSEPFVPHVIEPSLGVDRTFLAVLLEAYSVIEGGRSKTTESIKDEEVVLKLPKALAPIKVAVLPLSKKEELTGVSQNIAQKLRKHWMIQYDVTGSIGKRYRRQDEIGTPYCVTVDFDSLKDKKVTVRDRDTMKQERIVIDELVDYLNERF